MSTTTAVRTLDATPAHHTTTTTPTHRRRVRSTRRTLRLVPTLTIPQPRPQAVRLHPVDLGPWDD